MTDLRSSGYLVDEYESFNSAAGKRIAFGSNDELVILNQSGRHLGETAVRAFVLDSRSGQVVRQVKWARIAAAFVFGIASGGYAILGENGTVVYSPGLLTELARSTHDVEMISPNGQRCAARTPGERGELWITMDCQSMEKTGEIPRLYIFSISSSAVASLTLGLPGGPVVEIRGTGEPVVRPVTGATRLLYVSERALVIASRGRYDVIADDGELLLSGKLDGDHDWFSSSREGRRMALTQQFWSELTGRVTSERITVFDLDERKAIWTTKNKGVRGEDASPGVALSPDGTLIAINSRGLVSAYRLPSVEGLTKPLR